MSTRAEYLSDRFNKRLARYQPPRSLVRKTEALQAEVDALMQTILKYAPPDAYQSFLEKTLVHLDECLEYRIYPTVAQLSKSCKAMTGTSALITAPGNRRDDDDRTKHQRSSGLRLRGSGPVNRSVNSISTVEGPRS